MILYKGVEGIVLLILNLRTRQASRPRDRAVATDRIKGWVGCRAGIDILEEKNVSCSYRIRKVVRLALSLYRLRYAGS